MTVAAKTAFGAELWMAPSGTDPLVKVGELLTITPPTQSRTTIDATTHDSPAGAQEYIVEGTFDPGQIQGQVNYIAGSAGDTAMVTALTGGALQDFKIVEKGAAGTYDTTFSGFLTSYGPDAMPTSGKQTASFQAKVSGAVAKAASA
jgi:hypothetical protein